MIGEDDRYWERGRLNLWLAGAAMIGSLFIVAVLLVATDRVDAPFVGVEEEWAIAVAPASDPLDLDGAASAAPTIQAEDTGEAVTRGVADPFLVRGGGEWLIFFEILRIEDGAPNDEHGVIGLSTSSDGVVWTYDGVVLAEDFHLSYPNVFEHDGQFFMVPESQAAGKVILYRAETFPGQWVQDTTLLEGSFTDPTVFNDGGRWWMFATDTVTDPDDTLHLFHADRLRGPWVEHRDSPVVREDVSRSRSAGPVVVVDGAPHRYAQDNSTGYGKAVNAYRIDLLSETGYAEEMVEPAPLIDATGSGWNASGMHHVSPVEAADGSYLVVVDGYRTWRTFGLGS
jgi:hypothetical protein